uniref:Ribosomal protein S18 n=1 Tax=Amphora coffeiformis TaxID=265554 RepID=A0A7S3P4Y7_9STRA
MTSWMLALTRRIVMTTTTARGVAGRYGLVGPRAQPLAVKAVRSFSDKPPFSGSDENNSKIKSSHSTTGSKSDNDDGEDVFGSAFDDGPDNLGPTFPPHYVRDATTGRLTGAVQSELSTNMQQVLRADPTQQEELLQQRILAEGLGGGGDNASDGQPQPTASVLGQKIRAAQRNLNLLGRHPASVQRAQQAESPDALDDANTMQRLTPQELREFQAYMRKYHKVDVVEPNDIPTMDTSSTSAGSAIRVDTDWATMWRTEQAQRQMDDVLTDNPYADIMPQDLSQSPLVSRRHAKSLPRTLLSYNNTSLLQSFLTETGQIKSRVQSRLGARDQRRVAKLVKRARNMGLIPYSGQFRVEQHGWVHDPTLQKPRPWEVEMERRGLRLPTAKSTQQQQQQQQQDE